jgi:hypothetical protein
VSDQAASITIEALTRLDLKPTEVLAVTVGWPDLTPAQLEQFGEFLTDWLNFHHMPVAGVLVLPSGSSMQAIAPTTLTLNLQGSYTASEADSEQLAHKISQAMRRQPPSPA